MIYRREFLLGVGALLGVTSHSLNVNTGKRVTVTVECVFNNKQCVVFDDLPQTIFVYDGEHRFKVGDYIFVDENHNR